MAGNAQDVGAYRALCLSLEIVEAGAGFDRSRYRAVPYARDAKCSCHFLERIDTGQALNELRGRAPEERGGFRTAQCFDLVEQWSWFQTCGFVEETGDLRQVVAVVEPEQFSGIGSAEYVQECVAGSALPVRIVVVASIEFGGAEWLTGIPGAFCRAVGTAVVLAGVVPATTAGLSVLLRGGSAFGRRHGRECHTVAAATVNTVSDRTDIGGGAAAFAKAVRSAVPTYATSSRSQGLGSLMVDTAGEVPPFLFWRFCRARYPSTPRGRLLPCFHGPAVPDRYRGGGVRRFDRLVAEGLSPFCGRARAGNRRRVRWLWCRGRAQAPVQGDSRTGLSPARCRCCGVRALAGVIALERTPFIGAVFRLFATGRYSIEHLRRALIEADLRTRPTRTHQDDAPECQKCDLKHIKSHGRIQGGDYFSTLGLLSCANT